MTILDMKSPIGYVWRLGDDIEMPVRMTMGSVGYDICSSTHYMFKAGDFGMIRTGLVVQPPEGYHMEIALRSSIPKKKGMLIPNGMGIIDQDYCGENDELCVPMWKFGRGSQDREVYIFNEPERTELNMYETEWGITISKGERIAQLVFRKSHIPRLYDKTGEPFAVEDRGGFGSTGDKC